MLTKGEGKQATASSTTAIWTPTKSGANSLSVDVEGAADVFCLVNCTTAEFDAMYTTGDTIKVRSEIQYSFYGDNVNNVSSICYRTASADSAVNFAAF